MSLGTWEALPPEAYTRLPALPPLVKEAEHMFRTGREDGLGKDAPQESCLPAGGSPEQLSVGILRLGVFSTDTCLY